MIYLRLTGAMIPTSLDLTAGRSFLRGRKELGRLGEFLDIEVYKKDCQVTSHISDKCPFKMR